VEPASIICPQPRRGVGELSARRASVGVVLHELRISGLGVIDEAALEPHPGFTVVTGETGAGKTMIVTALGLITGGRGDPSRVRAGCDRAVVEARFEGEADGTAAPIVASVGGRLDEDGSVIAIRSVGADGRSRAYVGGRAAPLAILTELTDPLVAVHGQSEALTLLRPAQQRAVLDRFADLDSDLTAYRRVRARWQEAVSDLANRRARARENAQREQMLRLSLAEIAEIAPLPGEDADLVAEVRRRENSDAVRAGAQGALTELVGDETLTDAPTVVGLIQTARHDLHAAGDPRLAQLSGQLDQASVMLADVAADLSGFLGDLDADPARLEELLARQAVLKTLTRRYGADVDAVLAWVAEAERELDTLDSSDHRLSELSEHVDKLATAVGQAALAISERRREAAVRLGDLVTDELGHLAMGRAAVRVAVTQRPATSTDADAVEVEGRWLAAGIDGIDQVEIVMTAHSGAPELPIAKGASGGELSRVMLALEVVLTDADPVATLVFDEVDAGVGGRAATEIGRRLALLARNHQVIVVTHLAQVAAFADRHVVVDAGSFGAVGRSDLRVVAGVAREVELARMLGGTDGSSARAHARDLLAAAVTAPSKRRRAS
jgi:DNA repair protein RecN (Recombination protein N)